MTDFARQYIANFHLIKDFDSISLRNDPTLLKLNSFQRLPEKWNFGEGKPIPRHIVEMAESLINFATSYSIETNVFPGTDGNVAIAFYFGSTTLEVVIGTDNGIDYHIEDGEGFDFKEIDQRENVKMRDVYEVLKTYVGAAQWNIQELLTPDTLISNVSGLATSLLNIQQDQETTHRIGKQEYP